MDQSILDQFDLPPEAVEFIQNQQLQTQRIEGGVNRFVSGHHQGVAYRFFVHPEYNAIKSREKNYEVFDEIEMIQWIVDKKHQPTERVRMLPETLLRFDRNGECVGGVYKPAYDRFKAGASAPGTALEKWNQLTTGEVASLTSSGVYTVEQFAEMPKDRVQAKFGDSYLEHYERANQFVNGQRLREEALGQASKFEAIEAENRLLRERLEALEKAQAGSKTSKGRGRPKKVTINEDE